MAEYIEREAVEKYIENGLNNPNRDKAFGHDAIEIMAEVHYMPAADVVPVVRCRDCKYRFRNNGHDKNGCPITDADIWMDDNSFCSFGAIMDLEE